MPRIAEGADQREITGGASASPILNPRDGETLPWTITTGCWRTRRKTYCYVTDPSGEVRFAARRFWPCVAFLDEIEVDLYIIRPDDDVDTSAPPIVVDRRKDVEWLR